MWPMCAQTCILHTHLDRHACTITQLHTHTPDHMQTQQTLLGVCTHAWSHTCTHMGKSHTCMSGHTCVIDHKPPHILARCPCVQTHACMVTHTHTPTCIHETHMLVYTYISAQSHTVAHICTCPYVCVHVTVWTYSRGQTYKKCPCMCARTQIPAHIPAQAYVHINTHVNSHTNTCICTQTHGHAKHTNHIHTCRFSYKCRWSAH